MKQKNLDEFGWKVVEEEIERSRIKRINWKIIFGNSLTKEILKKKMQGLKADDTFVDLIKHPNMIELMDQNIENYLDLCRRISISVAARYGENNTALSVFKEMKK